MIFSIASFSIGGVIGFAITLAIVADVFSTGSFSLAAWTAANLGHSTWVFAACLALFLATLAKLSHQLQEQASYQEVVQLDQLGDVFIHLFVGIGVIWTAVGMRSALVNTLAVPESLASDASAVLGRLVDGGILLALSTTIVGAIGGYLMRLLKTVSLGPALTEYYHRHDRQDFESALDRLKSIERLLESLSYERSTP